MAGQGKRRNNRRRRDRWSRERLEGGGGRSREE